MIVVTVELRSAVTGLRTVLGQMVISNDNTGDHKRRNYDVAVGRKTDARRLAGEICARPLRTGRVEDYPAPSYNVWRLVSRAIRSAFPEER